MPTGFSKQDVAPQNPNIAQAVPIETDSERKQLYGPLLAADAEITGNTPAPADNNQTAVEGVKKPADPEDPTEEDKKAFIRAILGDKPYEKVFTVFGGAVKVLMRDRSVQLTETMYAALDKLASEKKIKAETEDQWLVWAERFQLAATVAAIEENGKQQKFDQPVGADFLDRVNVFINKQRPYYQALMEVGRLFERHVNILTENAQTPNFWQAGG